jgi:hypothetical protein
LKFASGVSLAATFEGEFSDITRSYAQGMSADVRTCAALLYRILYPTTATPSDRRRRATALDRRTTAVFPSARICDPVGKLNFLPCLIQSRKQKQSRQVRFLLPVADLQIARAV